MLNDIIKAAQEDLKVKLKSEVVGMEHPEIYRRTVQVVGDLIITTAHSVAEAVRAEERERLFDEIREFTFKAQPYEGTMIRVWLNNYSPTQEK